MPSPQLIFGATAVLVAASLGPAASQSTQPWPPDDPDEHVTSTPFSVAWAKKLRGFRSLSELQDAAGSKGRISSKRRLTDAEHPSVTFHWRSQPTPNGRPGWMIAEVYADGAVGADIITNDDIDITINTFGALICKKCSPAINALGKTPSWAR